MIRVAPSSIKRENKRGVVLYLRGVFRDAFGYSPFITHTHPNGTSVPGRLFIYEDKIPIQQIAQALRSTSVVDGFEINLAKDRSARQFTTFTV